ncbi:uncharacterized protein Z518_00916 [Rhinocladiella mackenziei CBS 650.93]|uniref:Rhinocladiella mackenziei CBS 650.93 unplaced genomic scaffold supercont1.1, whole genome shotgun sequence n=1 Tax=Rhinocladiella mackenziei CBS 650.93 TaxID=1442369 RepID=A0A0D2JK28_9EURO|nr:uncharacterized protein Z518_00916 [Rhinocladiella mackenziei CBS 650.93]KIX09835.1 hypothetical protein Z518_00916 [Rhinocladiella mackenziei CBS 650.93]
MASCIVTLKHTRPGSCICSPSSSSAFVRPICPRHGDRDFMSKTLQTPQVFQGSRGSRSSNIDSARRDQIMKRTLRAPATSATNTEPDLDRVPLREHDLFDSWMNQSYDKLMMDLPGVNNTIWRALRARSNVVSDPEFGESETKEHPALTSINFLDSSLEFRQIVYRYLLVPEPVGIVFSSQKIEKGKTAPPRIDTSILLLSSQVYKEATKILYGENTFIAAEPGDLFYPTGIDSLRRRTTRLIRHLSFVKSGTAEELCKETVQNVYEPIRSMICNNPAFLSSLEKITIRREVLRPDWVRTLDDHPGSDNDKRASNVGCYQKKDMVMTVAAKLAFCAAKRSADFEGLWIIDDDERAVDKSDAHVHFNSVIEVCLTRSGAMAWGNDEEEDMGEAGEK